MTKETKKWLGDRPENCECCGGKIGEVFYDCRIPSYYTYWRLVCHNCFIGQNCKLGTGHGQKYNTKTLEKLDG